MSGPDATVRRAELEAALERHDALYAYDQSPGSYVLGEVARAVLAALDSPADHSEIATELERERFARFGDTPGYGHARLPPLWIYRAGERHALARIVADEKGGTDGE